jgi:hypothetical protein
MKIKSILTFLLIFTIISFHFACLNASKNKFQESTKKYTDSKNKIATGNSYFHFDGIRNNFREILYSLIDVIIILAIQGLATAVIMLISTLLESEYKDKKSEKIKKIKSICESNKSNKGYADNTCAVCYDILQQVNCNVDNEENFCAKLECGHCFHSFCIVKWMEKQNKCPICREEIDKGNFNN